MAQTKLDRLVAEIRACRVCAHALPHAPRPVVGLLNREIRAVLDIAEVRRNLVDQGMDPAGGSPEQFGALIKSDMDKWGDIGKRLGVKLD